MVSNSEKSDLSICFLVCVRLLLCPFSPISFPKDLCVTFISLTSKLNNPFPPQFDMILGKLENDGSRKVS